ncbi:MAG TPA: hypothetical protein VK419_14190, partial [Bryobacteraceae bacterium]|nr:hypothetical protein [Bryobacteraceae bacterium]
MDPSNDPATTGQTYQELFTNVPFSSQILTGVFLEFAYTNPAGTTTTYTHTVLDRIGYAAREGLAAASVSIPAGGQPAFSPFDSVTMSIDSSLMDTSVPAIAAAREDSLMGQLNQGVAAAGSTPVQQLDPTLVGNLNLLATLRSASATQTMAGVFDNLSQATAASMAAFAVVKAYPDSPLIRLYGMGLNNSSGSLALGFSADLAKDSYRALAYPGQSIFSTVTFNLLYGVGENIVERQVVQGISVPGGTAATSPSSAADVLSVSSQQGSGFLVIQADQLGELASLGFSADAQARITDAVDSGKIVVAPGAPVAMAGGVGTAWYELDPDTGAIIDTNEMSEHQGIVEYSALMAGVGLVIGLIVSQAWPVMAKFKVTICGGLPANSPSNLNFSNTPGGTVTQQAYSAAASSANGFLQATVNVVTTAACTTINILLTGAVKAVVALAIALVIGVIIFALIAFLPEATLAGFAGLGFAAAAQTGGAAAAFGLSAFLGALLGEALGGFNSQARPGPPLDSGAPPGPATGVKPRANSGPSDPAAIIGLAGN